MLWTAAYTAPLFAALVLLCMRPWNTAAGALLAAAALPALALGWAGGDLGGHRADSLLLGAEFGLDPFRASLLTFSAFLWSLAGGFCGPYLAGDRRRKRHDVFFALSMAGNFGLIMAADVPTFYGFFVLMTFASYGLVIHKGTGEARRAARVYLVMAIIGEILLLAALFLAVHASGSFGISGIREAVAESPLRDLTVALALAGFGVKAGAVPLYFWLPLAHPVAPTPASAVLSGAMIKAGLLGWYHFLPLGEASLPAWGAGIIGAGIFAALWAAAVGTFQTHPKTILAYSSISQMGVMTTLLGIGLSDNALWPAVAPALALYAAMHGLAKGALFLGTAVHAAGHLARIAVLGAHGIAALVIVGAPPLAGFVAKFALKDLAEHAPSVWAGLLPPLITVSGFATALLLTRFLWASTGASPQETKRDTEPAAARALPWALSVAAAAAGPFVLNGRHDAPVDFPSITAGSLFASIAPVAVGGLFIVVVMRSVAARPHVPLVPPGDFIVLIEKILGQLRRALRFGERINPHYEWLNIVQLSDRIIAFETTQAWVDRVEARLETWKWVGFFFILFTLGFLALLFV
ncbi:MAG: NADH dehydrogenase [Opitutales bacterium]|nr:NADH dehydrogenase [Opitutales bacterium]